MDGKTAGKHEQEGRKGAGGGKKNRAITASGRCNKAAMGVDEPFTSQDGSQSFKEAEGIPIVVS